MFQGLPQRGRAGLCPSSSPLTPQFHTPQRRCAAGGGGATEPTLPVSAPSRKVPTAKDRAGSFPSALERDSPTHPQPAPRCVGEKPSLGAARRAQGGAPGAVGESTGRGAPGSGSRQQAPPKPQCSAPAAGPAPTAGPAQALGARPAHSARRGSRPRPSRQQAPPLPRPGTHLGARPRPNQQ